MFLMVLFAAAFRPVVTVCIQITALAVLVLVFVIVRSRVAAERGQIVFAVFPLLPSMITQSAPLSTIIAVAEVPDIEGDTPAAGLIVSVFTALANGFALMEIGNVSP